MISTTRACEHRDLAVEDRRAIDDQRALVDAAQPRRATAGEDQGGDVRV